MGLSALLTDLLTKLPNSQTRRPTVQNPFSEYIDEAVEAERRRALEKETRRPRKPETDPLVLEAQAEIDREFPGSGEDENLLQYQKMELRRRVIKKTLSFMALKFLLFAGICAAIMGLRVYFPFPFKPGVTDFFFIITGGIIFSVIPLKTLLTSMFSFFEERNRRR
jgi:hypothetical protein